MKHLHDDELLMSALDGIDDLDLSQLDAKQAKEFQALSLLKSDLKLLNDIPECQLSSERLRRRILEEGMQPKARTKGWFWFASAGAISCAGMAAAAVMIWNWYQPAVPAGSQTLALNTEKAASSATLEPGKTFVQPESVAEPVKSEETPVAAVNEKVEPRRETRRNSTRPIRIRTNRPVMTVASTAGEGVGYLTKQAAAQTSAAPAPAQISSDAMPEMEASGNASASAQPAIAAKTTPGGRPASVVVISQSSTPEPTVESAGHVVFGG